VYGFAIQSGGAATIASEVGRGTTVTIYLPRAMETAQDAAPPREPEHGITASGRVLLVEDNVEIGNAVSAVLREMGYAVRHVANADEGFTVLQHDAAFDLLLTDIVMPGSMSGLDLARAVGRHHPGVPVLLMSGYSAEAEKAAAEGYRILSKPFRPEALADAIRRVRRPRREQASRAEA
jgi:two-component system NtrC family sensor kinase